MTAPTLDVLLPRSESAPRRFEPRADEAELVAFVDERPADTTQHTGPTLVVRANMIATLDGAATGPDHVTGSINGAADLRVFESLRDLNQAQGTALVLVFLPMQSDHRGLEADHLRAFVRDEAHRLGIRYVDLVTGFKELADQEAEALFFREDAMGYAGAEGHYTVRGNEYVAQRLRDELAAIIAGSRAPEPAPTGSPWP